VRQSAPSASLQMMQNQKQWLIHPVSVQCAEGLQQVGTTGQQESHEDQQRKEQNPAPEEELPQAPAHAV